MSKLISEITHSAAWKTSDPAWAERRADEWRRVYSGLEQHQYKASEIKMLREYFLKGTMPAEIQWDGRDLPSLPLFHRLWLSADQSEENWRLQAKFTNWSDYRVSVEHFFRICSHAHRVGGGDGIGGLERRMYGVLLGGETERAFLERYYSGKGVWTTRSIMHCYRAPRDVIAGLTGALQSTKASSDSIARYELRDSLRLLSEEAWLPASNLAKRLERLNQLFDLILERSLRHRELSGASKAQLAEKDELADELAAIFDEEVGPSGVHALWKEKRKAVRQTAVSRPKAPVRVTAKRKPKKPTR